MINKLLFTAFCITLFSLPSRAQLFRVPGHAVRNVERAVTSVSHPCPQEVSHLQVGMEKASGPLASLSAARLPAHFAPASTGLSRYIQRAAAEHLHFPREQESLVLSSVSYRVNQAQFDRLPFIILTKEKLTAPIAKTPLLSQLDIAPTVLDLMNMEIPRGMFGHSIFDTQARRTVFDIKEDYAVVTTAYGRHVLPLRSSRAKDKALLELMSTFIQK